MQVRTLMIIGQSCHGSAGTFSTPNPNPARRFFHNFYRSFYPVHRSFPPLPQKLSELLPLFTEVLSNSNAFIEVADVVDDASAIVKELEGVLSVWSHEKGNQLPTPTESYNTVHP